MDKKIIKQFIDFIKRNEEEDGTGSISYVVYPEKLIDFLTSLLTEDDNG